MDLPWKKNKSFMTSFGKTDPLESLRIDGVKLTIPCPSEYSLGELFLERRDITHRALNYRMYPADGVLILLTPPTPVSMTAFLITPYSLPSVNEYPIVEMPLQMQLQSTSQLTIDGWVLYMLEWFAPPRFVLYGSDIARFLRLLPY